MKELAPSILAADFSKLGVQLEELEQAGIGKIHIDVMDGQFVPNISMGFPIIRSLRPCTKMQFDVHLMIQNPENYVQMAADAGANSITIHAEACVHLHRVVEQIHQAGCLAGVALNPATSLQVLEYILEDLDLVLLMTVNPGFGGQTFIAHTMNKIADCYRFLESRNCKIPIELDGGINLDNAKECLEAGADILVAGSSVFHGDVCKNAISFQKILQTGSGVLDEKGNEQHKME